MRKVKMIGMLVGFSLLGIGASCNKQNDTPDGPVIPPVETDFIFGADLSYVNQIEDNNGVFKVDGEVADAYKVFADGGTDMVRLRLWHNPSWVQDINGAGSPLYSGVEDVAKSIKRAKAQNMTVNLDFHYSDDWADPGKQTPPLAWEQITDILVLCDSVYNYTFEVMSYLKDQNALPDMVQIGNETNCGMMHTSVGPNFPKLSVCDGQWANFGKVINAGIKAVRDIDQLTGKTTQIALHVADPKNLQWWFSDAINKGKITDFDVAGFSYYHIWHTTISFNDLPAAVKTLKNTINKEVMILETAYPFTTENNDTYNNIYGTQAPLTGYPYTLDGQKKFMIDLCQNMMDAGATGVFYWEPAWITSGMKDQWGTGSAWENCALFNFSGNLTGTIDYMTYTYETQN